MQFVKHTSTQEGHRFLQGSVPMGVRTKREQKNDELTKYTLAAIFLGIPPPHLESSFQARNFAGTPYFQ